MTNFPALHDEVFHMLDHQLPSFLTYHSPKHTRYVLEQAEIISMHENVSAHDLYLIKTAALFHDIGFIQQYKDHEEAGCEITREFMHRYSFDPADAKKIFGMIMATKIPQRPHTLLEMIVADADLEYLGTDLFYKVSQLLYKEMLYLDPDLDIPSFNQIQIKFLSAHTYHTDFCKNNREEKKLQNLRELMESIQ
ncbi:MAG: HD domain-containing protein [Saprospiraceae bacterium]|uniref:HD domain-containing protein n=1 Tax=Candidatus Opimibacter skivensis TaxID=2982028 RepID=A0A9D7SW29_9BACT|nr:HD domain-containing protein [Candidatus Opimibacter skivensis]